MSATMDTVSDQKRLVAEAAARPDPADKLDLATICKTLRALVDASSAAPWVSVTPDAIVAPYATDLRDDAKYYGAKLVCESLLGDSDRALIIAMRNTLPRLLDAVEASLLKVPT